MSRKLKLDFTGVESFQRASEGEHVCKIVTADEKQSQGGNDMIVIAYEVIKGEDKTARVFENYPLVDATLWKLKGMLQAIGMKADGKVQLDLDKLVGRTLIVAVKHEEYEGKTRARVDYVKRYTVEESDDDVVAEDEEEQEEEKPVKTKSTQKKAPMNKPEPEEDDDDWGDDEEEEPAPKKPAKPAKAKTAEKPAKKEVKKDDDDDDWDDDDWDD